MPDWKRKTRRYNFPESVSASIAKTGDARTPSHKQFVQGNLAANSSTGRSHSLNLVWRGGALFSFHLATSAPRFRVTLLLSRARSAPGFRAVRCPPPAAKRVVPDFPIPVECRKGDRK